MQKVSTKLDLMQLEQCEILSKLNSFDAFPQRAQHFGIPSKFGPSLKFKETNKSFQERGRKSFDEYRSFHETASKSYNQRSDELADCKRLKERLKNAMRSEVNHTAGATQATWKELIFGICEPNVRLGKEGSRQAASETPPRPASPLS